MAYETECKENERAGQSIELKQSFINFNERMPTVLVLDGFRFYFFSGEGTEPAHIHIKKGEARGKVWLVPHAEIDYLYGFTVSERRRINEIVALNRSLFIEKWNEYFR